MWGGRPQNLVHDGDCQVEQSCVLRLLADVEYPIGRIRFLAGAIDEQRVRRRRMIHVSLGQGLSAFLVLLQRRFDEADGIIPDKFGQPVPRLIVFCRSRPPDA